MKPLRALFLHHSTGGLLLRQGRVRELLFQNAPHLQLWDHGYNLAKPYFLSKLFGSFTFKSGLSDQFGKITGRDFDITISNSSPQEYAEIFSRDPKDKTLSQILDFDLIIFKNCFPITKINTNQRLDDFKNYYQQIFESLQKYPDKKFILFTPPPLRAEMTQHGWAVRARQLSHWLVEHQTKNITVFNFFDLLSDTTNTLKREYCSLIPLDSHPNRHANLVIGPSFVDTITEAIN